MRLLNLLKLIINIFGKLQNVNFLFTSCFSPVLSLNHALSPDSNSDVVYKLKQSNKSTESNKLERGYRFQSLNNADSLSYNNF